MRRRAELFLRENFCDFFIGQFFECRPRVFCYVGEFAVFRKKQQAADFACVAGREQVRRDFLIAADLVVINFFVWHGIGFVVEHGVTSIGVFEKRVNRS